jgi:hypothetical protein
MWSDQHNAEYCFNRNEPSFTSRHQVHSLKAPQHQQKSIMFLPKNAKCKRSPSAPSAHIVKARPQEQEGRKRRHSQSELTLCCNNKNDEHALGITKILRLVRCGRYQQPAASIVHWLLRSPVSGLFCPRSRPDC